jgi:hypothetical protein
MSKSNLFKEKAGVPKNPRHITQQQGDGLSTVSQPLVNLLTPRQVASQANYRSPVSVLRAFRRGDLPGYRLNARTIRFNPNDVDGWLAAARVGKKEGA